LLRIVEIEGKEYLSEVRNLFEEYAGSLAISLDFQGFDDELAELPGDYAPPDGCLLIALWQGQVSGCVALRPFGPGICEMKRLYTKPQFRGLGIGRALCEEVIKRARQFGYERMRLDTLPSMETARSLYGSLGFKEIDPYRFNPVEEASFMELTLTP
jgi:ribosomal protein S18 acetylase RimI-like enzyme